LDIQDVYISIASPSEGLFKDRGSRFEAYAYPVQTEEQVKSIVDSLKKKFHDARHHCYAYRIGYDGHIWRANDDGEPSGSAARQILSQIDSAGLSDILVVVVRWFGGIKLGIPGLIAAYRGATEDALNNAARIEKTAGEWYRLNFDYSNMPSVMQAVKKLDLPTENQIFDQQCAMDVRVRLSRREDFFAMFEKISIFNILK